MCFTSNTGLSHVLVHEDCPIDFSAIKGTDVLDVPNFFIAITVIYFQTYTEQMCIRLVLMFVSFFNIQTSDNIDFFVESVCVLSIILFHFAFYLPFLF